MQESENAIEGPKNMCIQVEVRASRVAFMRSLPRADLNSAPSIETFANTWHMQLTRTHSLNARARGQPGGHSGRRYAGHKFALLSRLIKLPHALTEHSPYPHRGEISDERTVATIVM